ncbi:hypothetical protein [Paenibacillus nanensis]|nr:hypothetical protein [Paenibacillus nanensis]
MNKRILSGAVLLVGCLYFYKNPEVFADFLTTSTQWFTVNVSNMVGFFR